MHEFIHGGELNDDFTALLDEGVKQRFVSRTRNVFSWQAGQILKPSQNKGYLKFFDPFDFDPTLAVLAVRKISAILLRYGFHKSFMLNAPL